MLKILNEAFSYLPKEMTTRAGAQMILSIVYQESDGIHRRQMGNGPARGLAQFELGGGVKGVLNHPASRDLAWTICRDRGVNPKIAKEVWAALEFDDVLALALARLLLWTDSGALPTTQSEGWLTYLNVWRPGKPHPDKWPGAWATAQGVLDGR